MNGAKTRGFIVAVIIGVACVGSLAFSKNVSAADTGEFSLQVSPSPLVLTLKPGETTTVDLKVRNTGTKTENLKIAPRMFKIGENEKVEFDDTKAPPEASWISFGAPFFTVEPGQVFSEKVTFAVPKGAGFSYSFALVINRQRAVEGPDVGRRLKGSVALFTLLNVDRPGAVRKLDVEEFTTSQSVYEYLPAHFDIKFKNTGNMIAQPAGNVFIQRNSQDENPIDTLAVNASAGYILPGTVRTLSSEWTNGFQVLSTTMNSDGTSEKSLQWNWNNLSNIPIGRYTAKLVAIYNDGQRDIPVVKEVSFWVIPWKLLLGLLVVLLLIGAGLWSFIRKISRTKRRKRIRF
ncbi:MAG TPA: hypothetical protein VK502_02095 [Candidatus Saccharimonadales bacterium]|nr:hypothetical protein [Candidatus Saccharimonadales bacterium]